MSLSNLAAATLLALLVMLSPSPTAADCQDSIEGWCNDPDFPCCLSKTRKVIRTCHPGMNACFPKHRLLNQPCIPGKPEYDCKKGVGLVCDPIHKKCLHTFRTEGEFCDPNKKNCKGSLVCEPYMRRCVLPPDEKNEACHNTLACTNGLTCHPARWECFHLPREEDEPCTDIDGNYNPTLYPCIDGTACEVGVTNECQLQGSDTWQACHDTLPCMNGFSCHPKFQVCFHEPRLEGEPCNAQFGCEGGLACDVKVSGTCYYPDVSKKGALSLKHLRILANHTVLKGIMPGHSLQASLKAVGDGEDCKKNTDCAAGLQCEVGVSNTCMKYGTILDECHPTKACLSPGYSCHPEIRRCYHKPRLQGEPCDAQNPCQPGLWCDLRATMQCRVPLREGEHCYANSQCMPGLSCDSTDNKCRYTPRQAMTSCGYPLVPGDTKDTRHTCAKGLSCHPLYKDCEQLSGWGESCYDTPAGSWGCSPGLTCQPGFQECYNAPRALGEPCDTSNPCAPGLSCLTDYPYCFKA